MPTVGRQPWLWTVTLLMAAVIIYGSLYPFGFRIPPRGPGPVMTFLASIGQRPGRGDALANVLLYMPFGFFFVLGLHRGTRHGSTLFFATLIGGLMSLTMELAQYYVPGRDTSFNDFATNTLGTLLGGLAAIALGGRFRLPFVGEEVSARPIPTLLVLSWLAYRLYPYVPTIDLHKYWKALKPVVLTPSLTGYDLFRQAAIWLTICALIEAIVRRRPAVFLVPSFVIAVLCAKVLITDIEIRLAEPLGAALALVVWLALRPARTRAVAAAVVLCVYVVALRLEPFTFQANGHDFGWIPFLSLMQGSVRVDTLAFLEKFFLYGSMIYLLGDATGHRLPAVIVTTALLFATSCAEIWIPGRSAEITDTLMVLIVAVIFALLPTERVPGSASGPRLTTSERGLRDWQREQARALGVKLEQ